MRPEYSPRKTLLASVFGSFAVNALLWSALVHITQQNVPRETPGITVELSMLPVMPSPLPIPRRVMPLAHIPKGKRVMQAAHTASSHISISRMAATPLLRMPPAKSPNPAPRTSFAPTGQHSKASAPALQPLVADSAQSGAAEHAALPQNTMQAGNSVGPVRFAPQLPLQGEAGTAPASDQTGLNRTPADAGAAVDTPAHFTPSRGPTRVARILRQSQPPYPPEARRDGVEGSVSLRVMLGANGVVQHIEIAASSGDFRLDEAARQEVARWQFAPRMEDGVNMPAVMRVRVVFQLDDVL